MFEQTEQESLSGWRKEFATLRRLCIAVPIATLEKITVALIMLLILMLPVEMVMRMLSLVGVYNTVYGVLGICMEITAAVWLGKRILVPEAFDRPQWTLCDAALLAMLGWSVLSTLVSPDPRACLFGDVYRMEGVCTYFIYAGVYVLLRNCCSRENIRRILICLVTAFSVICVFSGLCLSPLNDFLCDLLEMSDWDIMNLGTCGPFDNSNHFSYILGVVTVLAAGLYITDYNQKLKAGYLITYVLLIHIMILNESLGGYLASAIGLVACLVVACIRKDLQIRKAVLLLIVFVVVSCLPTYSGGNPTADLIAEMESGLDPEASVSGLGVRLGMWKDALAYIAQRPILGYGPDGSGIVAFPVPGGVNSRPHNEYLQYAVYLGIPGLAMYLTALGGLLVQLLRRFHNISPLCVVLACAVLTYCASAFVGNTMYYTTIYYVAILAMLVNESAYTYPETAEKAVR